VKSVAVNLNLSRFSLAASASRTNLGLLLINFHSLQIMMG
jgi:hypothetical protein